MTDEVGIQTKFYFTIVNGLIGEELETFNAVMKKYFIQHVKLNELNNKAFYMGLIVSHLEIEPFLIEVGKYLPIKIGMYKKDGCPIGITKKINKDTGKKEYTGTEKIKFNKKEYLDYAPDEVYYEDNILKTKRPTEVNPIHNFYGWELEELY